ncbi:epidermal differentiation-specific protein-like [Anomaloglossus baeobatrachus]|uniref:epidermal differentiation-specific protein-like n=1 Tax=Anomaloglossus baeobatrachus TaxID=238106 RepID=UPI003F500506
MNTIELFEFPNFTGDSVSLDGDNADLTIVGFNKKAQSLKVHGDPWVVFTDTYYWGLFKCFSEGDYSSIPSLAKKITSARRVKDGLYQPNITLYENIYYNGRAVDLEKAATSLQPYGFNGVASSLTVKSGAWILYSEEYFKGDRMIAVAGEYIPLFSCCGWPYKARSLKPLTPKAESDVLEAEVCE